MIMYYTEQPISVSRLKWAVERMRLHVGTQPHGHNPLGKLRQIRDIENDGQGIHT